MANIQRIQPSVGQASARAVRFLPEEASGELEGGLNAALSRFDDAARDLAIQLRRLPASEAAAGIRSSLDTLAIGFAPERIHFFRAEATPHLFVRTETWGELSQGHGAASPETLDLTERPALLARLLAGQSGKAIDLQAIFLPCLGVDGLLGVVLIEAGFLRDERSPMPIRGGLAIANHLAAFIERVELEGRLAAEALRVEDSRSVAHDLNNLMTAVLGYADLLSFALPEQSICHEDLAEIQLAAHSAVELIEQGLGGKVVSEVEARPIDLKERLESLRGLLCGVVGPEVDIEIEAPEDLPAVAFDPTTFERVVLNLASNARDAIAAAATGEGHFRLGLTSAPKGSFVRLVAEDDGCGIEPGLRDELFESGKTTKSKGEGHGLGLASIASAMSSVGGAIRLEESSRPGAIFHLDFPVG